MTQDEALKLAGETWGHTAFAESVVRDGATVCEVGVMSASGRTRYVRGAGPSWAEAMAAAGLPPHRG
ncbi:hypothetical protein [Limnoglobus roseus]|uniref:Uncharacterized protein n=1 Tax=Limnoglobus roseus TaxID=2598579 RepID=A0A5C1AKJ7_9BACT|nr:hypothetical protein [Limnoglobus roseus]QEL17684.1 hypothetical protein PX52LOC_04682 [Limnoglobus roseus]